MEPKIVLAKKGSVSAFRELVERYQAGIRVFLARFVHCPATADDLAQEVFLAAYSELDRYRYESCFSTWLYGIARNKALSYLRANSRRNRKEKEFGELQKIVCQSDREQEQNSIEFQRQQMKSLEACLKALPAKSFGLIEKFYFQGDTTATISAELQQSDGAIRMRLTRIRKILARCVISNTRTFEQGGD